MRPRPRQSVAIAYHFTGPAPDSMRADSDGNLYVAMYGQGRVSVQQERDSHWPSAAAGPGRGAQSAFQQHGAQARHRRPLHRDERRRGRAGRNHLPRSCVREGAASLFAPINHPRWRHPETSMDRPGHLSITRRTLVAAAAAAAAAATTSGEADAQPAPAAHLDAKPGAPAMSNVSLSVNGEVHDARARHPHDAARRAARAPAADRQQEGLRPRPVRRLHGHGERPADQFLPDAGRHA